MRVERKPLVFNVFCGSTIDLFEAEEYQGMVMRRVLTQVVRGIASFLLFLSIASGQGLHRSLKSVSTGPPAPDNPHQAGRICLNRSLDDLAAALIAARAAKLASIHSQAEAESRQAEVRKKILSLIGTFPTRTPLKARVVGETQAEGFRIRKVIYESQPNFAVTALLYLPGHAGGRQHPAILLTPGHYPDGKASDSRIAALFAQNGFVVLSCDPIGEGERLQYPDPEHPSSSLATTATGEHGEASLQPMLIGDAFARYEIWDAIRGVDYLSHLPGVDPKRIGALGCSGGGTVTAMVGALDRRIAAIGVACYITSFDALLPTLGPQDGEQSIPHFIASGLDFPDWIELAAPRPYAVISTYSDMFPFSGARASVIEARRFYSLFDATNAGTPSPGSEPSIPSIPSAPALNPDTSNKISPSASLQFITGPGRHGELQPILGMILSFFMRNLEPGADADHPHLPPAPDGGVGELGKSSLPGLPHQALQVTRTGQVATSIPNCASVYALNRERARTIIQGVRSLPEKDLLRAIDTVTGTEAIPGASKFSKELLEKGSGPFVFPSGDGIDLHGDLMVPQSPGRHPAVVFIVPNSIDADDTIARTNRARFEALAAAGNFVLAITPRPSPPGNEEMKTPLLGPFYLLSLRADLVGRTLIGMRIDDVIRATDYLASRQDVDKARISGVASGHMGLVLLHAAVLDPRLSHIAIDHVLVSYRSLLNALLPIGAAEDIAPGVLLHYDIPDLVSAVQSRLTETDPLQAADDRSQKSTPVDTPSRKPRQDCISLKKRLLRKATLRSLN